MDNWNEIRTAYQVARLGTVSAAAEALNVHRSTVIRHIDTLEAVLGEKIFLRHAKGYTPTDLGFDLMRVARATDEQFSQLVERATTDTAELSGEFILTSLYILAPLVIPILKSFQTSHPKVIVRYLTGERLFRLDYGEAHVAVRAGPKPSLPEHIVQPFIHTRVGLYASADYISRNGIPQTSEDFANHCFIGLDNLNSGPPFNLNIWMRENIPEKNVVLRGTDVFVIEHAVLSGIGIGFFPAEKAKQHTDLIEISPHQDEWDVPFWLITHADLHQTAKVQAFLSFLQEKADEQAS
ncbi:MAG: LysR family transcriptional regulator [Cyanobacteria bacterium P01_A01_bin.123]